MGSLEPAKVLLCLAAAVGGCATPSEVADRQASGARASSQRARMASESPLPSVTKACEALADELAGRIPAGKVVGVLPFTDDDGGVKRLGVVAGEEVERLLLARDVKLTDRQHLDALLAETDLQLSSLNGDKTVEKARKLSAADVLVLGRITQGEGEVLVSARALSVDTGTPLAITGKQSVPAQNLGALLWYVRRPETGEARGNLPPLALRYELFSPADGREIRLTEGATVRSQQQFKVRVQPNSDCYLYVLLYDSQGKAVVLFPHEKIGLPNQVRGGVCYELPEGNKCYWFDDDPGVETFYLLASHTPLKDLDQLLGKMQDAGGTRAQLDSAAREHIDKTLTRGMSPRTGEGYRPRGMTIKTRGVGGVTDIGWGQKDQIDSVVTGYATVVAKIALQHK